jgi:hypothetical protein
MYLQTDVAAKLSIVRNMINLLEYNHKLSSLADFCEYQRILFEVQEAFQGFPEPEITRVTSLTRAVAARSRDYYSFQIGLINLNPTSYDNAVSILVSKENEMMMQKITHKISSQLFTHKQNHNGKNNDTSKKDENDHAVYNTQTSKTNKNNNNNTNNNSNNTILCFDCGAKNCKRGHSGCTKSGQALFMPANLKNKSKSEVNNTTSTENSSTPMSSNEFIQKQMAMYEQRQKDMEKHIASLQSNIELNNVENNILRQHINNNNFDGLYSSSKHDINMISSNLNTVVNKNKNSKNSQLTSNSNLLDATLSDSTSIHKNFSKNSLIPSHFLSDDKRGDNTIVNKNSALTNNKIILNNITYSSDILARVNKVMSNSKNSSSNINLQTYDSHNNTNHYNNRKLEVNDDEDIDENVMHYNDYNEEDDENNTVSYLSNINILSQLSKLNDAIENISEKMDSMNNRVTGIELTVNFLKDQSKYLVHNNDAITLTDKPAQLTTTSMGKSTSNRNASKSKAVDSNDMHTVNMLSKSNNLSKILNTNVNEPVIDSACTDHISPRRCNLTKYVLTDPNDNAHINYGGNKKYTASIMGTGDNIDNIRNDVLHVPSSARELISVPKLMSKYLTIFVYSKCYIYTINDLKLVMTGTLLHDNLVHLDKVIDGVSFESLVNTLTKSNNTIYNTESKYEQSNKNNNNIQMISNTNRLHLSTRNDALDSNDMFPLNKYIIANKIKEYRIKLDKLNLTDDQFLYGSAVNRIKTARSLIKNESVILHNRCGHIGNYKMHCMCVNHTAIGIGCTANQLQRSPLGFCIFCYLATFNKFPAPRSFHLSAVDLNRTIISDIKGKFKYRSIFGNYYFQLHYCPGDDMLWMTCLKDKSDAIDDVLNLHSLFAKGTDKTLGWHQSDFDKIYLDRRVLSWAQRHNIILQCTAPYRHEGAIESWMETVMGMLKANLISGNLPQDLWEPVGQAAITILTSTPSAKYPDSCAITRRYGVIPDISYFVPLGYPAVAKVYSEEMSTKTEAQGIACRVIGYSNLVKNGYLIQTVDKRILVRKDVIVNENTPPNNLFKNFQLYKNTYTPFNLIENETTSNTTSTSVSHIPVTISAEEPIISSQLSSVALSPQVSISVDDSMLKGLYAGENTDLVNKYKNDKNANIKNITDKPTDNTTRQLSTRVRKIPDKLSLNTQKEVPHILPYAGQPIPDIPHNLTEAIADDNPHRYSWLKASNKEMRELIDRVVFKGDDNDNINDKNYINKCKEDKPFKSKNVFRANRELDEMIKWKARVVAGGYSQIFMQHYDVSNSPVAMYRSILITNHISTILKWYRKHLDTGNAFLEALLDRDIYMWLPEDWTGGKKIKVKLARNLYGLKQAGLLWYLLLSALLIKYGYIKSIYDPCTFYLNKIQEKSIANIHVDDKALHANNQYILEDVYKYLQSHFKKITDLGALCRYIGIDMELEQNSNHLCLSQKSIINEIISKHVKFGKLTIATIPLNPNHLLNVRTEGPVLSPIWEEVGMIRYLTDHSRPDLAYVASKLGQSAAKPQQKDIDAIKQTISYINNTKNLTLKVGGKDTKIKLFCYCDSSTIRDGDSLPHHGIVFYLSLDSGAILWKSVKGKLVVLNSTEGEIDGLTEAIKDIIWIRGFLSELGFLQEEPTKIYQDNKSTITLSNIVSILPRTRYIANRLNFIRQAIQDHRIIYLVHIPTIYMVADALTKALPPRIFMYFRNILLNGHNNIDPLQYSKLATIIINKSKNNEQIQKQIK